MTDPFLFLKESYVQDDPAYRAPQDAVGSWMELAEQAKTELTRMGFAASVVSGDEFLISPPAGAHLTVYAIQPFGVTLDWHAPVEDSAEYQKTVLAQDIHSGLFRYVVNAKQIVLKAMLDVLAEARFRTLMDPEEGNAYHYRVLGAPGSPKN